MDESMYINQVSLSRFIHKMLDKEQHIEILKDSLFKSDTPEERKNHIMQQILCTVLNFQYEIKEYKNENLVIELCKK